jgi:protease-4
MSEKRTGCLTAFLVLALLVSAIVNLAFLGGRAGKGVRTTISVAPAAHFGEEIVVPAGEGDAGKRIAVISVRGIISTAEPGEVGDSSLDDLLAELKQARNDASVAAVLLRIDSPGGEVTASDILYEEVSKTRAQKPVVVSMDAVAASGGYYVSCGGSYLFAHETSITASIGVIMQSINYQNLLEKLGLEVNTFKSGKFKDLLNGARELTEAEREYVQGLINQSYSKFVGIVARERNLDEAELRKGVADGRIVSGSDALREHLVDQLGGFEQALEKARELGKAPGAAAIRFTAPLAFGKLVRFLSEAPRPGGKVKLEVGTPTGARLPSGRLYFLSPVLMP